MSTHPNNPKKPFTHWKHKRKFQDDYRIGNKGMQSIYTPRWYGVDNCMECKVEIDKSKNSDSHKHICLEKDCPKPVLCPLCWQGHFVKNGKGYDECKYKVKP